MREKILLSGEARFQLSNALLKNPCELPTECSMSTTRETGKVPNPVVVFDSIDVVDNPTFRDFSIGLLPDMAVFKNLYPTNRDINISISRTLVPSPRPKPTLVPNKSSFVSGVTVSALFRPFMFSVATRASIKVASIKHLLSSYLSTLWATGIITPIEELKRLLAGNTIFNHTESVPHFRSIVKEGLHA